MSAKAIISIIEPSHTMPPVKPVFKQDT